MTSRISAIALTAGILFSNLIFAQQDPPGSSQVQSHKAKEIVPYKAKTIEVYKAKTIEPDKRDVKKDNKVRSNAGQLIGVWHTKVPGAVWQSPSEVAGYDKLHVSAGAKSGDLVINKNGTYKWNSYGGKSGRWEKGDSEYPIVLIDKAEHKKWKVGFDEKHTGGRDIVIWDGYVWYDGKK